MELPPAQMSQLGDRYDGPLVVVQVHERHLYTLRRLASGRLHPHQVHVERLRRFIGSVSPDPGSEEFSAPHNAVDLPEAQPDQVLDPDRKLHVVPDDFYAVTDILGHRREGRRRYVQLRYDDGDVKWVPYSWCDTQTRKLVDQKVKDGLI